MNILAHMYLSGGINQVLIGNFIGDFVKGNKYKNYPENIKQGILLHRFIDKNADNNQYHKNVRDMFRPKYNLYSGIVADIVFDHFLSTKWDNYCNTSLNQYAQKVYNYIAENDIYIPPAQKIFANFMIKNNWLQLYTTTNGIEKVLNGMSRNTSLPNYSQYAIGVFTKYYYEIENNFEKLIKELSEKVIKYEKIVYLTCL